MTTSQRVLTACGMGGAIGALLALQFNHHFWWVGILIGGGVGYLSYGLKEIFTAAKEAWKNMPEKHAVAKRKEKLAHAMKSFLKVMLQTVHFISILFCATVLLWNIGLMFFYITEYGVHVQTKPSLQIFSPGKATLLLATLITSTVALCNEVMNRKETRPGSKERKKGSAGTVSMLLFITPILGSFTIALISIWVVPQIIWQVGSVLLKTAYKLTKSTFIAVHSELRLLCMLDAMIGATAGYFLGNALLGGIIGALSGLLNYEIVSVRWLKLVKAPAK